MLSGGSTDVVCSCDVGGKVLVWTVSRVASHGHSRTSSASSSQPGGGGSGNGKKCIISRRPQRQFICPETTHMGCDISWALGVVVCCHDEHVSVFSIERNERLVCFRVLAEDLWTDTSAHPKEESEGNVVLIRRINLTDDGFILLALTFQQQHEEAGMEATLPEQHVLATYTLRGHCVRSSYCPCQSQAPAWTSSSSSAGGSAGGSCCSSGDSGGSVVVVTSPVTFLSVPGRGSTALSGHEDGTVMFFDARNLQLLYQFRPHDHSLTCIFSSSSTTTTASSSSDRRGVVTPSPEQAPILCARVGPCPSFPAVLCVTTAGPSGGFYICALPDFSKWDRARNQSTLSQLAHVPMAVMRGSLQQAQNLTLLASDGAGQLAQNAKSLADDALAKVRRLSIYEMYIFTHSVISSSSCKCDDCTKALVPSSSNCSCCFYNSFLFLIYCIIVYMHACGWLS